MHKGFGEFVDTSWNAYLCMAGLPAMVNHTPNGRASAGHADHAWSLHVAEFTAQEMTLSCLNGSFAYLSINHTF